MDPLTGNIDSKNAAGDLPRLEDVLAEFDPHDSNMAPNIDKTAAKEDDPTTARFGNKLALESDKLMEELMMADDDPVGSRCEIMGFYNHSTDPKERNAKWSEFEDLTAEETRIKELGKAFAVIHRRSKIEQEGNSTWITHSIEAQSPRLRKLLDAVFYDYPAWYSDATPYAVCPPFKPYVHRWDHIVELCKRPDLKAVDELQLLRRELEQPIASHLSALEKVKKTKTVPFMSLWLILAPGCLMVTSKNGSLRLSLLLTVDFVPARNKEAAYWVLGTAQSNWNGSHCGLEPDIVRICEYNDSILITKLNIYPIEFAPDPKEIESKLLTRGRKFESLRGFHVKTCTGKKYILEYNPARGCKEEVEKPVSGRVIVDAHAYYKVQNMVAPTLVRRSDQQHPGSLASEIRNMAAKNRPGMNAYSDSDSSSDEEEEEDDKDDDEGDANKERSAERKEDLSPLSDLERILASPRVKGFDLEAKEWCEFNVDDIEDVQWDETPYENLVLPDGEKELITAFADRPGLSTHGFDDFVAQKGKGIIILLCGPPGVGKTLTAEAVAEKSRVPLYILSASDLGTAPEKVESGLMKALECCRLWNSILLLDEADVFLETRDSNSLNRNELVSIFLRRLEYYKGLMFLTTNRINAIDPAFKSRLDLILPYHDLDESSRRKVWVNFIQILGSQVATVSESDFDQLAKAQLNGREIKNSIKTALVLANRDKPLRLKHFMTVLNIRKRVEELERQG